MVSELAEQEGISRKFLKQILLELRRHGTATIRKMRLLMGWKF
jgi:DNA-binding IscR family transcriptional regulator